MNRYTSPWVIGWIEDDNLRWPECLRLWAWYQDLEVRAYQAAFARE